MEEKNVAVIVLGDIGRSPRMQYHSKSFAENGFVVDVIGYGDSKPLQSLCDNRNVTIRNLWPTPVIALPKLFEYIFKTLWQTLALLFTLTFKKRRSHYVIVQNPPAIPSLFVAWLYCRIFRTRFIIDWHNYANTIMALSLSSEHKLVKIASRIEYFFGRLADTNFCVTRSMQEDLRQKYGIKAHVLYDRPPDIFRPISLAEKHKFFMRLSKIYQEFSDGENSNVFTRVNQDSSIELRDDRPALLVSSTSWTEDEDFSIILEALEDYENEAKESGRLPRLICVITGKGPQKEYYCDLIKSKRWERVSFLTPWLEIEDYPLMLASADLGVCLHKSSSGLDLPMKVVDMFGCGLPVCAHDFNCLNELVKNDLNGYTFRSVNQLSQQIQDWFRDYPNNPSQNDVISQMRKNLEPFSQLRWQENWNTTVLPVIFEIIDK